jgi:TraX protein
MSNVATRNLTTLDLFKAFAVITMIIDHLGFCFFVESLTDPMGDPYVWFRTIGRLCVPIWFFLVGYANSRDVSPPIWIGAFILLAYHFVSGMYIFPLNVLFTIIFIRLIIDRFAVFAFRNWENLAFVFFVCTLLFYHTGLLTEYGSVGLVLALAGFAARHKGKDYGLLDHKHLPAVMFWASVMIFGFAQWVFFLLDKGQITFVLVGTAILMQLLMKLKIDEYPRLTSSLGPNITAVLQIMGRRTLEIYVIHLLVFLTISWLGGYGYPIYGWFDWEWTAPETFDKMRAQLTP